MPEAAPDVHDKLMAIAKRRGYVQPAYEIYGGVAGFFDYGPLGSGLKNNLENLWRAFYVLQEGMLEVQCPTISPEAVFRASGHLEKFADTVIECPACGTGSRADHFLKAEYKRFLDEATHALKKAQVDFDPVLDDLQTFYEDQWTSADQDPTPDNIKRLLGQRDAAPEHEADFDGVRAHATPRELRIEREGKSVYEAQVRCPGCAEALADNAEISAFNLMFRTHVGPGKGRTGYMRPETAQGIFMDFQWLYRQNRERLPFGGVQVGKAFRNEISPRQSLLRLREFHQMEAEVFFDPENKTWAGFDRLKDRELTLLTREAQEQGSDQTERTAMGKAVEQGVIANGALGYFIALTDLFLTTAGIPAEKLRFRQHLGTEKAHYSTDTWDAEFLSPRFGWVEIVGIADRTDYDLKAHMRVSGQRLTAFRQLDEPREEPYTEFQPDFRKFGPTFKGAAQKVAEALKATPVVEGAYENGVDVEADGETYHVPRDFFTVETGTRTITQVEFTPHVVEPSYGVDRIVYATLETAYDEKEWPILRLAPLLAPLKAGVFPLMPKDGLDTIAQEIDRDLRASGLHTQYDDSGSIGKRYARQDEVGTPFCVTVDYDTKEDGTVTLRDRDTAEQVRVPRKDLGATLARLIEGSLKFGDLTKGKA